MRKEFTKLTTTLKELTGCSNIKNIEITYKNPNLEKKLLEIKNRWRNWVILERDKNNGSMAVACPCGTEINFWRPLIG